MSPRAAPPSSDDRASEAAPSEVAAAPAVGGSSPESVKDAIHRALSFAAVTAPPALARRQRALRRELASLGLVSTATMRVRDPVFGDRRVRVEYYPDAEQPGAVLMRLMPLSSLEIDANAADRLITTTQAAELLGVSRPYVTRLSDRGVFGEVVFTEGGQRRLSRAGVLAHKRELIVRQKAKAEMDDLGQHARDVDLETARQVIATQGARWVKVAPESGLAESERSATSAPAKTPSPRPKAAGRKATRSSSERFPTTKE